MFDLGHMTQAIWSSTQGYPLEFSYRGDIVSRLSLHVELIYYLLAPVYKLIPSPVTLLVIQAILFGIGAFPLYRLARRYTNDSRASLGITLIYLFYPGAQMAVLFDFHGDTLAMPLLIFALEALDRNAWFEYGVWLLLSLSCKLYIAAPVCMLGSFLLFKGRSRVGSLTLLGGAAWGATLVLLVRPLFTASSSTTEQMDIFGYIDFYYGGMIQNLTATIGVRLFVALLVFAPVLPLVSYALDWTVLAFAVALPVLLSSGPGPSFGFLHHRYAMVTPFICMIVLHGVARLKRSRPKVSVSNKAVSPEIFMLSVVIIITLLFNMRFVSTPLRPPFWSEGFEQGVLWEYKRTPRNAVKDDWLKQYVPDEAPLLTSPFLAPHLANRRHLHLALPLDDTEAPDLSDLLDQVDYAVLDGLFDHIGFWLGGDVTYDWDTIAEVLQRQDYGLISARDGLLLFQHRDVNITDKTWKEMTLAQSITSKSLTSPPQVLGVFGDKIDLLESSITPLGDRHYRFRYVWSGREGLSKFAPLFAVTRVEGIPNARVLHLPTMSMYPTTSWSPDERVIEVFEVELPSDIESGLYEVSVSWYDSDHRLAYATDSRSRIGDPVFISILEVSNLH
jgi:uncharacterized membrane protein